MMKVNNISYLSDILTQVQALRYALPRFDPLPLETISPAIQDGAYDRIILTGMGASFYSLYPTWLYLTKSGLPIMWVDTAELLHYAKRQITPESLIWIVSQSGRSAEITSLLEHLRDKKPGAILGVTNDLTSPLAETVKTSPARSALIPIDAEPEITVSTRTYTNSLVLCQLGARVLYGEDLSPSYTAINAAIDVIEAYLKDWEAHREVIGKRVGKTENLILIGRGSSVASVYCGALILGEAGKIPATGIPAGQFRHGPLEMCGPDLTVILFAGPIETRHFNQRLAIDIKNCGGRVFWVGPDIEGIPSLPMPLVEGLGQPFAEILPIQLLTIYLAQQSGLVPGKFKHIGKVTLVE
jgi:glucosamine--fructose-6-phosphate aminotransferase (isomerizing)